MKTPREIHAYCPNSRCPGREGHGFPGGGAATYSEVVTTPSEEARCPHCRTPLRTSCPHCHHAMETTPFNYCPLCGGPLQGGSPEPAPELFCRVCGRRMYSEPLEGDIPLCSEKCIADFIAENIRVCDQCGVRFYSEGSAASGGAARYMGMVDGESREFCSKNCMTAFLSERNGRRLDGPPNELQAN